MPSVHLCSETSAFRTRSLQLIPAEPKRESSLVLSSSSRAQALSILRCVGVHRLASGIPATFVLPLLAFVFFMKLFLLVEPAYLLLLFRFSNDACSGKHRFSLRSVSSLLPFSDLHNLCAKFSRNAITLLSPRQSAKIFRAAISTPLPHAILSMPRGRSVRLWRNWHTRWA